MAVTISKKLTLNVQPPNISVLSFFVLQPVATEHGKQSTSCNKFIQLSVYVHQQVNPKVFHKVISLSDWTDDYRDFLKFLTIVFPSPSEILHFNRETPLLVAAHLAVTQVTNVLRLQFEICHIKFFVNHQVN